MWCQCQQRNPLDSEQRQHMVQQIINLRQALQMTPTQFGALLTRLHQGERDSQRKYWIGLNYYPAYVKRWEAGDPPSWWALVTMKQIADAHNIPFQLPVVAAPHRIQSKLPPGEYYQPEESLLLADLPAPLPLMRPGKAYAPSQKIRKYRPREPRRNPAPMNSLTDMGLDYTYRNPALMNSLTDMGLDYSCDILPGLKPGASKNIYGLRP